MSIPNASIKRKQNYLLLKIYKECLSIRNVCVFNATYKIITVEYYSKYTFPLPPNSAVASNFAEYQIQTYTYPFLSLPMVPWWSAGTLPVLFGTAIQISTAAYYCLSITLLFLDQHCSRNIMRATCIIWISETKFNKIFDPAYKKYCHSNMKLI